MSDGIRDAEGKRASWLTSVDHSGPVTPPCEKDRRIAQLTRERDAARVVARKLAEAMEPFRRFAVVHDQPPNWVPDGCPVNTDPGGISDLAVGAFRRASAALSDPAVQEVLR